MSRRLADDVARLLLRFGVTAEVAELTEGGYPGGFIVTIGGRDDRRRFLGEIGVHGAYEEAARGFLDSLRAESAPQPPPSAAKDAWDEVGAILGGNDGRPAPRGGDRLRSVAAVLDRADMEVLATNDVLWDEVVSIEPDGVEQVFDATVLGTHNFIANGIAVHNSIEQDADMVILLHREDQYEKESPRAGEADFIVAKHRNGPTATVTVAFQGHYSRFVDMAQI